MSPDELEGAGSSAQTIAEQIPGEAKTVLAPSDQASSGLAGWSTGAALHDCTYGWQKLVDGLSGDMDGYGGKLIKMAQGYRQSDQGAASALTAAQVPSSAAAYQVPARVSDPFGTVLVGSTSAGPAETAPKHPRGQVA
ncbi:MULTISPECIES: hypothetical protein [unclassified Kitasatospora]|uniref:hypothetical protein n=1 Tax=unclassified Kitasatospora TaxID=2633591 RepID=UPI0024733316|nr:hypothetical protein [Kitasatospora sp. MAP12-44]